MSFKKKLYLVFVLAFCFFALHALQRYFKWQDDNPVEELVEDVIKLETGVNIDFTPGSKE